MDEITYDKQAQLLTVFGVRLSVDNGRTILNQLAESGGLFKVVPIEFADGTKSFEMQPVQRDYFLKYGDQDYEEAGG